MDNSVGKTSFCAFALWLAIHASAFGQGLAPGQLIAPADMTATERSYYDKLGAGTDAANNFIITRSYVRICQQVAALRLAASQLPDRPAGFNVQYLLPEDSTVINRAVAFKLLADQGITPTSREMTAAQILTSSDLTQEEQDFYKTLAADEARNFILTRSYVRLCQQVADHRLDAAGLPDKPLGFSSAYLLPGDDKLVDDAIKANLTALLEKSAK